MIVTPAPKLALLHGARFQSHGRLLIEGPDGDLRDYSNQGGIDWFESIEWGKTVDNRIAEGTVELRREAGGLSLSPMLDLSPLNRDAAGATAPALDMNRRVEYWEQVTDPGAPAVEADWVRTFDGRAQKVRAGSTVLQLLIADRAIELVQRILRTARTYGTEAGVPVQTVMQALLDDEFGAGVWPLYVPVDPGFNITEYTPLNVSAWEALEELSKQFAGYVEYRASSGLTLVVPDRADTTPVATIGPGEYKAIPVLDLDLADIRTVVAVTYKNKATGKVETVEATAPQPTIDAYGDQYLGVTEADTSVIDTPAEAQAMANGIRDDVATPRVVQQVVNWAWYPVELGDVITWEANGVHYDTDQSWAVTGFRHRRSRAERETTFDVRGAPLGGYRRWLKLGHNQPPAELPAAYDVYNIRLVDGADAVTADQGSLVDEVWGSTAVFAADLPREAMIEALAAAAVHLWDDTPGQLPVTLPGEGEITGAYLRSVVMRGGVSLDTGFHLFWIYGTPAPLSWKVEASESGGQGTLTATVLEDTRGVVSDVRFWKLDKGTKTGPLVATGTGAGVWSYTFDLDPKHPIVLQAELVRSDGNPNEWAEPATFDFDKIALVDVPVLALDGTGTAHVTVNCTDTDIATGAGGVESRVDGGAWTPRSVDSVDRIATWDEAQTDAVQLLEVRGINLSGTPGPIKQAKIPPFTAPPGGSARILSALVEEFSPGTCSPAVPLVNRITVSFEGAAPGDTWSLRRFEDGTQVAAPASGISVATTSYDDSIATDSTTGSAVVDVAYLVTLSNGATMWTQTLKQRRAACP